MKRWLFELNDEMAGGYLFGWKIFYGILDFFDFFCFLLSSLNFI